MERGDIGADQWRMVLVEAVPCRAGSRIGNHPQPQALQISLDIFELARADVVVGHVADILERRYQHVGIESRTVSQHDGRESEQLCVDRGLLQNGTHTASGAQTERRGGAWPVGGSLGGKDPPAALPRSEASQVSYVSSLATELWHVIAF